MTVEEALAIVGKYLPRRLNHIQDIVFRQSWERQSYQEISSNFGYDPGYIRDVGSELWQLLSEALGEKVTKKNFHQVLKQHLCNFDGELQLFQGVAPNLTTVDTHPNSRQDWGEAINASVFFGRSAELAVLKQWIVKDRCQLVVLLGMGGIGKTALAVRCAELTQNEFEYLIWQSLRNAPPIKALLAELILFLSNQQEVNLPATIDSQISRVMKYLRSSRCLLVLDNVESILRSGERGGRYRDGYDGYGQLFRRVGDERHQSCLVLTSREKPVGLSAKEGKTLPVRSLKLTGLQQAAAQAILKTKGLAESDNECEQLINYYMGNPLALNIAATAICSLFDGNISKFLEQGTIVFDEIWELLNQQFSRLSALEEQVMYWLAINREWMTLSELRKDIVPTVSHRELLEALNSLQQRSLIEQQSASFTQQPVVMEYMTEQLVNRFCE